MLTRMQPLSQAEFAVGPEGPPGPQEVILWDNFFCSLDPSKYEKLMPTWKVDVFIEFLTPKYMGVDTKLMTNDWIQQKVKVKWRAPLP